MKDREIYWHNGVVELHITHDDAIDLAAMLPSVDSKKLSDNQKDMVTKFLALSENIKRRKLPTV